MQKRLSDNPALQKVIVSDVCYLRPLQESDGEEILQVLANDPSIRDRVTVASRMHTLEDVNKEIKAYREDNEGLIRYAIVYDEVCVGLISLWKDSGFFGQPPEPNTYGFGYFLDPAMRGKGIVTSAISALMDKVEETLPVKSFIAYCEDDNQASTAILRKLGYIATDETYSEPTHGWSERKYIKKTK